MAQFNIGSRDRAGQLDSLKPTIALLRNASPWYFWGLVLATLVASVIPVFQIYLNAQLLGTLANHAFKGAREIGANTGNIPLLIACLALTTCTNYLLSNAISALQNIYQKKATQYTQITVIRKAGLIDLRYFEDAKFHNQMMQAMQASSTRPLEMLQVLLACVRSVSTGLAVLFVSLSWHWWIFPVFAIPSLLNYHLSKKGAIERINLIRSRSEDDRKAQYTRSLLTSDTAAKEIRLWGLQDYLISKASGLWGEANRQDIALAKRKLIYRDSAGALLSLDSVASVALATYELVNGALSFTQFALYTQATASLQNVFKTLAVSLAQVREIDFELRSYFDFLNIKSAIEPLTTSNEIVPTLDCSIVFKDVSFVYPGTQEKILNNVSFELRSGEVTALVGSNGAGKSTIVKLIAGFYEPTDGAIFMDGVDYRKLSRGRIRSKISFLLQDYQVYNVSVGENIAFGKIDRIEDQAALEHAAEAAGIAGTIRDLPLQFDTILGRFFTRGHELSGGQRQQIALSRAIFRDAPILVLDEPTASLDARHQLMIFEYAFASSKANKLTLLVSHKLSALQKADKILVLTAGSIASEGTHAELLCSSPVYKQMWDSDRAVDQPA